MDKASSGELSDQLNQELKNNEKYASYGLKARVYENGLVQVQGIVDVLEEKHQVADMIRKFPGVKKLDNDITVCTDGPVDDEDVAFEVSEELLANPEIPDSVGVKVSGGEAHLVGNVSNYDEILKASETASKARGVRDVKIDLKMADEVDDISIINSIQDTFMTELEITPGKVKVASDEGVVTLYGTLSERKAELAAQIASRQPGVRGVNVELNRDRDRTELDDQVVIQVMNRISDNPYLNEQSIGIEVEEGRIVLTGKVDSREAKKDIEDIIHHIAEEFKPDILAVENKLRLETDAT